ncbi:MAG: twin-arginine translocase TatA/TatE family subunit [Halobacteriovoraceae bacterium]|nr:twin-arginine translocase TatA/TatE family subunit [Halobacteriovoraceae bacterium]
MFGLGAGEILIIFALALIFIGPKKLPELAKSLGRAVSDFQKAKYDLLDDVGKGQDLIEEPKEKKQS